MTSQRTIPPVRPELVGIRPYSPPRSTAPVRLNTNENPYPPSPELQDALVAAITETVGSLNRYPDPQAPELRADLARYLGHGLDADRVWAANGSNEIMLQLLQAFGGPGRTALGFTPTYSMYPQYARNTGTEWTTATRTADFGIDTAAAVAAVAEHRPDIVVLTSPNNPTGTALPLETIRAVAEVAPGLVVVDEAYAEFQTPGTPSALSLLESTPQMVVTRTMSKAFAFAGARVGYVAAAPEIVDVLQVVRLPFHLSRLTQAAARVALRYAEELLATVQRIRTERDTTIRWLREHGFEAADSDTNFVLFGVFPDRHAVWQGLEDQGVLIRETGPDGWLRVTIGTPEEMAAFTAALEKVTRGR